MPKLLSLCAAAIIAASSSEAVAQVKWDLTNEYAAHSLIGSGNQFFAERVKALSDGQLLITPHFNGSLGFKSKDVLDAVGRGAVQMGDAAFQFWSGIDPIFQLAVLPFVVPSTKEAYALYEIAKPYYAKALQKNNQYLVYVATWPPNGVWSKRPLGSTNALKGLKIRTTDPASTITFRVLQAFPQQLAWADVIPLLATGGIEAVVASADGGASAKMWDHVQHFTAVEIAWALSPLTVNKDAFDKLSESNKKALREAAAETEARQWKAVDERVQTNYAELRAHKVNVTTTVPAEMKSAMAKAGEPILKEWLAKAGGDGKAIIDGLRKRSEK